MPHLVVTQCSHVSMLLLELLSVRHKRETTRENTAFRTCLESLVHGSASCKTETHVTFQTFSKALCTGGWGVGGVKINMDQCNFRNKKKQKKQYV